VSCSPSLGIASGELKSVVNSYIVQRKADFVEKVDKYYEDLCKKKLPLSYSPEKELRHLVVTKELVDSNKNRPPVVRVSTSSLSSISASSTSSGAPSPPSEAVSASNAIPIPVSDQGAPLRRQLSSMIALGVSDPVFFFSLFLSAAYFLCDRLRIS